MSSVRAELREVNDVIRHLYRETSKLIAKEAAMQEGWVKVYESMEEYQAVLIRELLESHGLHPVLMDKKDDEFRIGHAEVYVSQEELDKAKQVISENKAE